MKPKVARTISVARESFVVQYGIGFGHLLNDSECQSVLEKERTEITFIFEVYKTYIFIAHTYIMNIVTCIHIILKKKKKTTNGKYN